MQNKDKNIKNNQSDCGCTIKPQKREKMNKNQLNNWSGHPDDHESTPKN